MDFLIFCYFKQVLWIMDLGFRVMHTFLTHGCYTIGDMTWLNSKNHILLKSEVKSYVTHEKYLFLYLLPNKRSLFDFSFNLETVLISNKYIDYKAVLLSLYFQYQVNLFTEKNIY